jgi:hypothetical protein
LQDGEETEMTEETKWEIVDDSAPQGGNGNGNGNGPAPQGLNAGNLLRAMLGPWWRWKVAVFAVTAAVLLTLLALFAGVIFLAAAAGVILSLVVAKFRKLLRRPGGSVTPR